MTDSSGSMYDSKPPAVSLNALSMFENALTMFGNDFEMDLQRTLVPLKNIANVSKRNGNALQRIFTRVENALQRKNATTLFSLSLLFPKRVTYSHLRFAKYLIATFEAPFVFFGKTLIRHGISFHSLTPSLEKECLCISSLDIHDIEMSYLPFDNPLSSCQTSRQRPMGPVSRGLRI